MRPEPEHLELALPPEIARMRRLAIMPAFNEEGSIGAVIDEIRAFDPDLTIVVVDDGSGDRTSEIARSRGVHVVTLPFNPVSYTHLRAHETRHDLVCRLLLEKKK